MSVAFSPDGKTIASSGNDATVRHWEVSTGKVSGKLCCQQGAVNSVVFSPDGKNLATGGSNTTALIWLLSEVNDGGGVKMP